MPSPDKIPLTFNRDRAARQLDARLEELLEKLRKNRPSEDPWMLRRAYEIATERHHDQFRSSGDPYLSHLLEVAHILADMRHSPPRFSMTPSKTPSIPSPASKNASAPMSPISWKA